MESPAPACRILHVAKRVTCFHTRHHAISLRELPELGSVPGGQGIQHSSACDEAGSYDSEASGRAVKTAHSLDGAAGLQRMRAVQVSRQDGPQARPGETPGPIPTLQPTQGSCNPDGDSPRRGAVQATCPLPMALPSSTVTTCCEGGQGVPGERVAACRWTWGRQQGTGHCSVCRSPHHPGVLLPDS